MASSQFDEKRIINLLRWLTRILGILLIFVIVLFAVGEGFPNPLALTVDEQLGFVALIIMLAGLILAWKFEGMGGLLVIIGYIFFVALNSRILGLGVFMIFPIVGLSFLFCWQRTRKAKTKQQPDLP